MSEFRDQDHRLLLPLVARGLDVFGFATTAIYVLFARVALRVLQGSSTMGDLAIFGAAAARLRATVEGEISSMANLLEQMLNISDLRELLAAKPRIVSPASSASPQHYRGEINSRGYRSPTMVPREPALRDISLTVRAGETLAHRWREWLWKNHLGQIDGPVLRSHQWMRADGRPGSRRHRPQGPSFSHLLRLPEFRPLRSQLAENISYGDWRQLAGEAEQIERVATEAGIDEMIRRLPKGYETVGRQAVRRLRSIDRTVAAARVGARLRAAGASGDSGRTHLEPRF